MKRLNLFLFAQLVITISCSLYAQQKEFTVGNDIYVYDSISQRVSNIKNSIKLPKNYCRQNYTNEKVSYFHPATIEIFKKERIDTLAKNKSNISVYTTNDSTGIIKEAFFFVKNIEVNDLLISELQKLEKVFVGHKINFNTTCKNQEYFRFVWTLSFRRISESLKE